jgi:thiamine transport system permease protein
VLCLTSFAVVLTLGGGPKATTLELAIYQSFRFELDFGRASFLAFIQLAIAALTCVLSIIIFGLPLNFNQSLDRPIHKRYLRLGSLFWDFGIIILMGLFLTIPLISVLLKGVQNFYLLEITIWTPIFNSITLALLSALISTILAMGFMNKWGEVIGTLSIAVSPLIIGAGLFLMIRNFINPFEVTFWVILTVNSIMGLPFAIRIMRPASDEIITNFHRLSIAYGMTPFAWFYWVYLPRLKGALTYSMGLVAALSMGDLGVIVLFGGASFETLPLVIYQLMSAYRIDQAMASAVILVLISIGIFLIFDRIGKTRNA